MTLITPTDQKTVAGAIEKSRASIHHGSVAVGGVVSKLEGTNSAAISTFVCPSPEKVEGALSLLRQGQGHLSPTVADLKQDIREDQARIRGLTAKDVKLDVQVPTVPGILEACQEKHKGR